MSVNVVPVLLVHIAKNVTRVIYLLAPIMESVLMFPRDPMAALTNVCALMVCSIYTILLTKYGKNLRLALLYILSHLFILCKDKTYDLGFENNMPFTIPFKNNIVKVVFKNICACDS